MSGIQKSRSATAPHDVEMGFLSLACLEADSGQANVVTVDFYNFLCTVLAHMTDRTPNCYSIILLNTIA